MSCGPILKRAATMRELWPPLALIEERLSRKGATSLAQINADGEPSHVADDRAPTPEALSALVGERIRQIDAARMLRVDQLRPGLIVLVAATAICLNRPADKAGTSWLGWIAAPDTEYATAADVLLEPDDEPFDPYAAMVQTWNPAQISLPKNPRVLAMLSPARLDVLRAVAAEAGNSKQEITAQPGFVFLRGTDSGQAVLTGTPLGGQDDPRHAYQNLYRECASTLRSAPTQQAEQASLWQRIGDWIGCHRPQAYGLAATVMVAALVGALVRSSHDVGAPTNLAKAPDVKPQPTVVAQVPVEAPPTPAPLPAPSSIPEPEKTPSSSAPHKPASPTLPPRTELAAAVPRDAPPPSPTAPKQEPPAGPIVLASLEESRFDIPLVRSKPEPSAPVMNMTADPTHVLRVVDRESIPKALDLLRSLGIEAEAMNSTVPAIMLALPSRSANQVLEAKLVGSGLFKPRSDWLKSRN